MRIGIEAQRLLRPHKHGMDIVALEIIHALQCLDQVNEYFVFVRPDKDEKCLQLRDNFTLVQLPGANYIHWEQVALPKAVRNYQLDVLHCTANTAPWLTDVPLILTLHDVLFLTRTSGVNTATAYQRLGNLYRALLVPRLMNRCGRILTVSAYAGQQIKTELKLPHLRIDVLHNGVSDRFARPITAADVLRIRAAYQLPERYCFFLGSADPRKNLRNVLLAFIQYGQTNQQTQLVISGERPGFLTQLLTPDEYAFIQARCRFVGYIHDSDLPTLYGSAEMFLFPSVSEGFGLPILEAMACGTPVITSTLTAMPEVAGDAALFVNPHQPGQIAAAMQQLADDPVLRQTLIRRGKERVTHFSWKRTARQLLATYQSYDAAQPTNSPVQPRGAYVKTDS